MSNTPNDGSGNGDQSNQPRGGQPPDGQARDGQSTRNPPQDGRVPGGQPPQGQQQRAPVQTGPSVSDIFSRDDTLDQIKLGVAMYALVGVGVGLGMFGIGSAFSGQSGSLGSALGAAFATAGTIGVPISVSAILAMLLGREIGDELSDLDDNMVFATAGVTALAGSIVTFLISWLLLGLGTGTISFGDLILPIILAGLGAAIIAAGTIWIEENLLEPSGAPSQGRQQY